MCTQGFCCGFSGPHPGEYGAPLGGRLVRYDERQRHRVGERRLLRHELEAGRANFEAQRQRAVSGLEVSEVLGGGLEAAAGGGEAEGEAGGPPDGAGVAQHAARQRSFVKFYLMLPAADLLTARQAGQLPVLDLQRCSCTACMPACMHALHCHVARCIERAAARGRVEAVLKSGTRAAADSSSKPCGWGLLLRRNRPIDLKVGLCTRGGFAQCLPPFDSDSVRD